MCAYLLCTHTHTHQSSASLPSNGIIARRLARPALLRRVYEGQGHRRCGQPNHNSNNNEKLQTHPKLTNKRDSVQAQAQAPTTATKTQPGLTGRRTSCSEGGVARVRAYDMTQSTVPYLHLKLCCKFVFILFRVGGAAGGAKNVVHVAARYSPRIGTGGKC